MNYLEETRKVTSENHELSMQIYNLRRQKEKNMVDLLAKFPFQPGDKVETENGIICIIHKLEDAIISPNGNIKVEFKYRKITKVGLPSRVVSKSWGINYFNLKKL